MTGYLFRAVWPLGEPLTVDAAQTAMRELPTVARQRSAHLSDPDATVWECRSGWLIATCPATPTTGSPPVRGNANGYRVVVGQMAVAGMPDALIGDLLCLDVAAVARVRGRRRITPGTLPVPTLGLVA